MADVSRAASGAAHGNTVAIPKVKIFFQVFPGVKGTDGERGIAGVLYSIKTKDKYGLDVTISGAKMKTAADGSVEVGIPANTPVTIIIFDTEYSIQTLNQIEASTGTIGEKRRLALLGYEHGAVDGSWGKEPEHAALAFQADSNLNASGKIGTSTQNKLVANFGE